MLLRRFSFIIIFIVSSLLCITVKSQITVSGTVYDSTKLYSITGVRVASTGGNYVFTDSVGIYHITVNEKDSLSFYYAGRPTTKFPVSSISNYNEFDISLRIKAKELYKTLKEVRVFSKSHKEDSLENRVTYSKIFNYSKPGIRSESNPGSAAAGFDLDELIHVFRFRKNKENLRYQKFMVDQEQDSYINYRFSPLIIQKLTNLKGDSLIRYRKLYQPSYSFLNRSSQAELYLYIESSVAAFRKEEVVNKEDLKGQ